VLELTSDRSLRLRMGENARRLAGGYPESLWKQRWNSLLNRILAKNQEGGDSGDKMRSMSAAGSL